MAGVVFFLSCRRGGACPSCLVSEGFHFTRRVSPCGATSFARGGEGGKTPPGVSRGRLTAPAEPLPDPVYGGYPYTLPQKFRPAVAEGAESGGAPDGAVSINKGRADLGSAPTAASENYKKENNGRGEPLPYGVSGKRKQNRGGAGKQKRTKPQNIPELRPFYPYCARLRSFISCSYSRREASASLDMGRMTKMLKMVIRPMPTSPRSHTKV